MKTKPKKLTESTLIEKIKDQSSNETERIESLSFLLQSQLPDEIRATVENFLAELELIILSRNEEIGALNKEAGKMEARLDYARTHVVRLVWKFDRENLGDLASWHYGDTISRMIANDEMTQEYVVCDEDEPELPDNLIFFHAAAGEEATL